MTYLENTIIQQHHTTPSDIYILGKPGDLHPFVFPKDLFLSSAKGALDLHIYFCMCVTLHFQSFFQGVQLADVLTSDSGSGTLHIQLGV